MTRRRSLAGILFTGPALLYFGLVYYWPLIRSFALSVRVQRRAGTTLGLENFQFVLTDPVFWGSVQHTIVYVIYAVPLTIVPGLILAVLLHRLGRGTFARTSLLTLYLLPMATSLVAAGLVWEWIMNPGFGVANSLLHALGLPKLDWLRSPVTVLPSLAIIHSWLRTGFATLILLAGLQSIPDDYYEAAAIDGATAVQSFQHITLPLLNPQLVLVLTVELIFAFKVFDQVFVTTAGGPAKASYVLMFYLYDTAFRWNRPGEASVVAVLLFTFLLILSVLQWRLLRRQVAL